MSQWGGHRWGSEGVPRVRERGLRGWEGEGREGSRAYRPRAGLGRAGPLTRPSVQLQIFVIRSFLVLHLLGILGVCEGRGGCSSAHKANPPPSPRRLPQGLPHLPHPLHTHTHTRLGFRPGLQLLGHVHVFPAPICGDRSEGGTATPKGGQVTRRMREQEDTQAEGEGATGGRGLETPTPGWCERKGGGGGKREGGGTADPRRAPGRPPTHSETRWHSPHSQEHSRNLPPTPLEEKHGRPGRCYPGSPNADTQDFPRNQPEPPAHRPPPLQRSCPPSARSGTVRPALQRPWPWREAGQLNQN